MLELTKEELQLLFESCNSLKILCNRLGAYRKAEQFKIITDKIFDLFNNEKA